MPVKSMLVKFLFACLSMITWYNKSVIMKELPSISILVMSYNQGAYIADCIDSVLSQEYDGKLEFIFCDDNSSDDTLSIIKNKICKYTGNRRVEVCSSPINQRVAGNMNNGIKLARYDWIMRMDGDDIMHPDRVKLTAEAILQHPEAVAFCGRYKYFSTEPEHVVNPLPADLTYFKHSYKDFTEKSSPNNLEWWGGIMCMHRSIFDIFGPLPLECDVLDDTMFATRALMLGEFVSITNAVFIYYRRHENNVSSEAKSATSISEYMKADAEMRRYYKRGIHCHQPILKEIEEFVSAHPEKSILLKYFTYHFNELKRQGTFWEKSWSERISDAGISGPIWRKIPWAIRVFSPFTYALLSILKNKS